MNRQEEKQVEVEMTEAPGSLGRSSAAPLQRICGCAACEFTSTEDSSCQTQHAAVCGLVCAGAREIVEGGAGGLNDVAGDEGRAFGGALFGAFDAALPFEDGPAWKTVLCQLGEDCFEVDLAVAEGAESSGAIDPGLEAAINALATCGAELGVLDVKHLYAVVVEVNVLEIVELLDYEVTGIVEEVAARMIVETLEEHLEGDAVVEIFARVDFEAEVDVRDSSKAFRMGRQRAASSSKAVSIRPAGRCGQGRSRAKLARRKR